LTIGKFCNAALIMLCAIPQGDLQRIQMQWRRRWNHKERD